LQTISEEDKEEVVQLSMSSTE